MLQSFTLPQELDSSCCSLTLGNLLLGLPNIQQLERMTQLCKWTDAWKRMKGTGRSRCQCALPEHELSRVQWLWRKFGGMLGTIPGG